MSHRRRTGTMLGSLALLTGVAVTAVPAHAGPAESFTIDDAVATIADDANEKVAFVNTTREMYCTAEQLAAEDAYLEWILAGAVGDPPPFPPTVGANPLEARAKDVGGGSFRFSFGGPVPVELWTFEEGKSAADGTIIAPCIDTDGIRDLTTDVVGGAALFASGEGTWTFMDNDAEGAGPRSNVWGDRVTASLTGSSGDWSYGFSFMNHTVRGEYTFAAKFALRPR